MAREVRWLSCQRVSDEIVRADVRAVPVRIVREENNGRPMSGQYVGNDELFSAGHMAEIAIKSMPRPDRIRAIAASRNLDLLPQR